MILIIINIETLKKFVIIENKLKKKCRIIINHAGCNTPANTNHANKDLEIKLKSIYPLSPYK